MMIEIAEVPIPRAVLYNASEIPLKALRSTTPPLRKRGK